MRILSFVLAVLAVSASTALAVQSEFSGRINVIDGDTVDVGLIRVRLHGIDAPERDQTCTAPDGRDWACGRWVSDQVRGAFQGRTARCQPVDVDRYGRTVARCDADGADMGQTLTRNGWAFAYRKYSRAYVGDETASRRAGLGLHASRVEAPAQFRKNRGKDGDDSARQDCAIKGNISASGARIYHSPGQRDYDRTVIHTGKGERWFCSASQARSAGWRAAKR
jgi:endonuclease YncB( thermonuclease family)